MPSIDGPRFVTVVAPSWRVRRRRIGRRVLAVLVLGPAWLLIGFCWVLLDQGGFGLIAAMPLSTCAAALFWIVRSLVVRRQRVVTHLRRFGHTDLAVMRALRVSVRRHLRFVTLDDGTLPPMPTPWGDVVAAALRIPLTALTLALLVVLVWFVRQDSESAQAYVLGVGMLATIAASIVSAAVVVGRGVMARRRRVLEVSESRSLRRVEAVVAALGGRRWPARHLVPRVVVVRTTDAIWRETVVAASKASDAVLVDVSSPSEHVLWEIETVAAHRAHVIYIAAADSPLVTDATSLGEIGRRVAAQLSRVTVLIYRSDDWRDWWRFGRQLSNAVDNVMAASPRATVIPMANRILQATGFGLLVAIAAISLLLMDGL